jgi:hypothetical protein
MRSEIRADLCKGRGAGLWSRWRATVVRPARHPLAIQDVFRLTGRQLVAPIPQGRSSGQMGDGTVAWGQPSTQGLGGPCSRVCAMCRLGYLGW